MSSNDLEAAMPIDNAQTGDLDIAQPADADEARGTPASQAGEDPVNDTGVSTSDTAANDLRESDDGSAEQYTFPGHDGQALLLVYRTLEQYSLVTKVHVERPSSLYPSLTAPTDRFSRTPKGRVLRSEALDKHHRVKGEDDELVWRRVSDLWWQNQTWWHRYMPFWRPVSVDEVELIITRDLGGHYRAGVMPLAVDDQRREAEVNYKDYEAIIEEQNETLNICVGGYDDDRNWHVHLHATTCRSHIDKECSLKRREDAREDLAKLRNVNKLIRCFKFPELAGDCPTLAGMAQGTCIYDESDLDLLITRSLKQLEQGMWARERCRGLRVKATWQLDKPEVNVLASTVFTVVIIAIWRLVTGDWSVAAGFGSVAVGIATVIMMRGRKG